MKDYSTVAVSEFWIRVMEKLNASGDLFEPVPQVLRETCDFFEFGCGFIYEADHTATFFLQESHITYNFQHLKSGIHLAQELGDELMEELRGTSAVMFTSDTQLTPLEEALSHLFSANSMILIPINDQDRSMIAFVGLLDRRGAHRRETVEIDSAYAVLGAIANHVKLQLYHNRVQNSDRALRTMMDHMGIDIYVNDFETREILYANESMAAPYGGVDKLVGKVCWQALYEGKEAPCDFCPQPKLLDENGMPRQVYSWDYQRPFDGSWFRVFSAAFRWMDGRLAHVVSSVDITDNKRNEMLIRQMADYDALTGLPNRRKLMSDLEAKIQQGGAEGYLLFFDLDGFKQVNDTYGHRAGDELLGKIGNMLQDSPLTEGRGYRHGGDEFVIFCDGMPFERVLKVLRALETNFGHPWLLEDGEVCCNASFGVVRFPQDGLAPDDLIHKADIAMYGAKNAGKGQARLYNEGNLCRPEEYTE